MNTSTYRIKYQGVTSGYDPMKEQVKRAPFIPMLWMILLLWSITPKPVSAHFLN